MTSQLYICYTYAEAGNKAAMPNNKVSPENQSRDDSVGCCGCILVFLSVILVVFTFPLSLCFILKAAAEYERYVVFRLGRLLSGGTRGPGIFFTIPCIEEIRKFDLRSNVYDVPPQEILTRDSVSVHVNAILYYRVHDPVLAVCSQEDVYKSTQLLAATALRNVLGTRDIAGLLSDRENMARAIMEILGAVTSGWGVLVERVEIKDIRLPINLQRAMAVEAEAAREAKAKLVSAVGERDASRALVKAADVMRGSSAALQLRYLQTLNLIAAEKKSTIFFPIPIQLLPPSRK